MPQEIRGEQIRDQSVKRVDIELNYTDNGSLRAEDIPYSALSSIKTKIDSLGEITSTSLNELSDVVISSTAVNQVLKFNGTNWINSTISTGASNLNGLSDVIISSPTSGQVLKFDGSNWINSTVSIVYNAIFPKSDRFTSANINNAQISFTLTGTPMNANTIQVDVNGIILHQDTHWTLSSDGITLLVNGYTLSTSDELQVKYLEGQEESIFDHLYFRDTVSTDNVYKLIVSAGTLMISRA